MNFKLLFHVLGKAIKMLMALRSYLPFSALEYIYMDKSWEELQRPGVPFSLQSHRKKAWRAIKSE